MNLKGFVWVGAPWPSGNEWQRTHYLAKGAAIKVWHHDAHWQLTAENVRPPQPIDHYVAVVKLLRVGPQSLDRDNLWGGAKGLIDAMKADPIVIFHAGTRKILKRLVRPDGFPERQWGLYADDREAFLDLNIIQYITQDKARHGSFVKASWRRK